MIVVRDVMHIREGQLDEAIQLTQTLVAAVGAGQGFRLLMASSGLLSVLVVESEFASMGAFEQYRAANRGSAPFAAWLAGMGPLTDHTHREFLQAL